MRTTTLRHGAVQVLAGLFMLSVTVAADPVAIESQVEAAATKRSSADTSSSNVAVQPTPTLAANDKQRHRTAKIFAGTATPTGEDLLAMQQHIRSVSGRIVEATVGVRVDNAHGSGVIISADGLVLTAAHVAMKSNRDAVVILADGTEYRAKTLGMELGLDAGMVKLVSAGPSEEKSWPYLKMADSNRVRRGQWCLAAGHPGGYRLGRQPVLRIGRILNKSESELLTDCTLVGGDSGGPLLDLRGHVIGIHSRIGAPLTANLHVPVTVFNESWTALVNSETHGPYLGVTHDDTAENARIKLVPENSPAARAGIQPGDTVVRLDDLEIKNFHELQEYILVKRPGDTVNLAVVRNGENLKLQVALGDWSESIGQVRR